jgi:hypothetical protein
MRDHPNGVHLIVFIAFSKFHISGIQINRRLYNQMTDVEKLAWRQGRYTRLQRSDSSLCGADGL